MGMWYSQVCGFVDNIIHGSERAVKNWEGLVNVSHLNV